MTDVVYTNSDSNVLISEGESSTEITTTIDSVTTIESISVGPQGPPGVDSLLSGDITGDFLRWNEEDNSWEVKSEPIEFKEIVLTPAVAALLDKEGGLWYDSVGKCVMVCTDDH